MPNQRTSARSALSDRCHVVERIDSGKCCWNLINSCGSALDGVARYRAAEAVELNSDRTLRNGVGFYAGTSNI